MKRSSRKAPLSLQRKKGKEPPSVAVIEDTAAAASNAEMTREEIYLYYQAVADAKDRIAAKIEVIERTENDDSSYFDADFRYDDRDKMIEELQQSMQSDQERVHVDDIRQSLRDTSRWFESTIKSTNSFLDMIQHEKEELSGPKYNDGDVEEEGQDRRVNEIIMGDGEYNTVLVERTIEELKSMSDASIKQDHFNGVWSKLYKAKGLYEAAMEDFLLDMRGRIGEEIAEIRERERIVETQLAYLTQERRALDKAAATESSIKKIIEGKYRPAVQQMERTMEEKLQEIEALEEQVESGASDLKGVEDMRLELETRQAAADPFVQKRAKALVRDMLDLLYKKELHAADRMQRRIEEEEARIAERLAREAGLQAELEVAARSREEADRSIDDARVRCAEERVLYRAVVVKLREESMALAKQVRMLDDVVQEGQRVQKRHRFMERRMQQLRGGGNKQLGGALDPEGRYEQLPRDNNNNNNNNGDAYRSDEDVVEADYVVDIDLVARAMVSEAVSDTIASSPPPERLWPNPSPGEGSAARNDYLDMSIFREGAPEKRPKEVVVENIVKRPVLSCMCTAAYALSQKAQKSKMAKLFMKQKRRHAVAVTMAAVTFKFSEAFVVLDRVLQHMLAASCMSPDLVADLRRRLVFVRRDFNMLSKNNEPLAEVESSIKSMCYRTIQDIVLTSPKQMLLSNQSRLLSTILLNIFTLVGVLQNSMESALHPLSKHLGEADNHAMEVLACNVLSVIAGDPSSNYRNPTLLLDSLCFFVKNYLTSLAGSIGEESQLLHLVGMISSLNFSEMTVALRSPYDIQLYIQKKFESAADSTFGSSGGGGGGGVFDSTHRDTLQALEVLLFMSTHPHLKRSPNVVQKMAVELMARGVFIFNTDVKDSYVEYEDPIPIGNLASLQGQVYPPLLPALITIDLFRRLMEAEISRARFVARIGVEGSLADLQYLNASLPQELMNHPRPAKPVGGAATSITTTTATTAEPLRDMRDVHSMWIEDIAAILNNKIMDMHNIIYGVFEGNDLVVNNCNLSAPLRDKLSSHAEYLYRFTAQRDGNSRAAVVRGQPAYEECMTGIQRDRARIVRVLEAMLHPWEKRLQALQDQYTKMVQLKSERMGDADAIRAQIDRIEGVTRILEKNFAEYKKSKTVSEEAMKILNPPEENEQIKYLKFESFNYQKTYRELKKGLSVKRTELENLSSQKKLLLDMLLVYKSEQRVPEQPDEDGAFLQSQHHDFTNGPAADSEVATLSPAPLKSSFQPRSSVRWHKPTSPRPVRAEPPKQRLSVLGPNTFSFMKSSRSPPSAATQEEQEERQEQELLLPVLKKRAKKSLAFVGGKEYALDSEPSYADEESYWFDENPPLAAERAPGQAAFAPPEVAESLLKIVMGLPREPLLPPPPRQDDSEDASPFPSSLVPNALPMQVTVTIRPRAAPLRDEAAGEAAHVEAVKDLVAKYADDIDADAADDRSVEEDKTVVNLEEYLTSRQPRPADSRPRLLDVGASSNVGALQQQQARKYGLVRAPAPKRGDGAYRPIKPTTPSVEVWNFSHPTERSIIRVSEFMKYESGSAPAVRSRPAGSSADVVPQQVFKACAPPPREREAALLQQDLADAFSRINQLDLLERNRLLQMTRPHQPAALQPSRQRPSPRYKDKADTD